MPTERKRLFIGDTSKLGKEFRPIREKAGMRDVVLYDLRKTPGSWMAANGFTPAQIAAQLGHSSYKTSERYYVNARPNQGFFLNSNVTLLLCQSGQNSGIPIRL